MLSGNRQQSHKCEAGGMEEEGCRCGCVGGAADRFHLHDHHPSYLRQKETQRRRMAHVLTGVFVVLVLALVAALIAVTFEHRCHAPNHNKTTHQHDRHSSGANEKLRQVGPSRHQDVLPRALLTAPSGNITNGKYLQWEHDKGHAYCKGFKYGNGDLVVPRKGHYRVFLQVTYVGDEKTCPGILNVNVLYFREDYGKDRHLLSTLDTVTCNGRAWIKSLHTSGTIHLKANGILRVTSSQEEFITQNEHQTFFGVELLPRYSKPDKN